MADTPVSLLDQLRRRPDDAGWQRLVGMYTPLLHGWLRRFDIARPDADDLIQDTLTALFKGLPTFQHNQQTGAFRRWLRITLVNRVLAFFRKRKRQPGALGTDEAERALRELEDADSERSKEWDLEHDRHVVARLLDVIQPEFQPATWRAFQRLGLDGANADAVAAEIGISVNAVLIAKCRVLNRLRQLAQGLVDP